MALKNNFFIRMIYIIYTLPFSFSYAKLLKYRKYEKLVSKCQARLKKYKNDHVALNFITYAYLYKKDYELSKLYFKKLIKKNISYKTQKFFIDHLIRKDWSEKKYDIVINDCEELVDMTKNDEIKKILKKYLCNCYYQLKKYDKVMIICKNVTADYPNDIELMDYLKFYKEGVNKFYSEN